MRKNLKEENDKKIAVPVLVIFLRFPNTMPLNTSSSIIGERIAEPISSSISVLP